jgi:hypothetical protein
MRVKVLHRMQTGAEILRKTRSEQNVRFERIRKQLFHLQQLHIRLCKIYITNEIISAMPRFAPVGKSILGQF